MFKGRPMMESYSLSCVAARTKASSFISQNQGDSQPVKLFWQTYTSISQAPFIIHASKKANNIVNIVSFA